MESETKKETKIEIDEVFKDITFGTYNNEEETKIEKFFMEVREIEKEIELSEEEKERIKKIKEYFEKGKEIAEELKKEMERIREVVPESEEEEKQLSNNELDLLLNEKMTLLSKILPTLFKDNSVIIDGVLSLRRGDFYEYKCQYNYGLGRVKDKLINNIQSVKIDKANLDILEYVLSKINDTDFISRYGDNEINGVNKRYSKLKYKFKEIPFLVGDEDNYGELKKLNGFEISPNGNFSVNKSGYGGGERENKIIEIFAIRQIKAVEEYYRRKIQSEVQRLKDEIKEIKEKCSKQLLIASLKTGN
jgi:hypothetical protein